MLDADNFVKSGWGSCIRTSQVCREEFYCYGKEELAI